VEAIEHAKELVSDKEDIILKEGQTYYQMGDAEKAIKLYTELLGTTKDKKAIYRLIRKTRNQYYKEKLIMTKGNDDADRLKRAHIYLLVNKPGMAEKELRFIPKDRLSAKQHTLLKAKLYLMRSRPLDALEIMKDYPLDEETAPVFAEIYEALGSYEAAARVLRESCVQDVEQKINTYEKLAQERRLAKGRYFIEGRS
jgi:predicted Zn-dependent protease